MKVSVNVKSECATSLLPFIFPFVTPLLLLRKQDPTSPVVIGRYFGKKRVFLFGVYEYVLLPLSLSFLARAPIALQYDTGRYVLVFPIRVYQREGKISLQERGERELPRQFSICPPLPSFS